MLTWTPQTFVPKILWHFKPLLPTLNSIQQCEQGQREMPRGAAMAHRVSTRHCITQNLDFTLINQQFSLVEAHLPAASVAASAPSVFWNFSVWIWRECPFVGDKVPSPIWVPLGDPTNTDTNRPQIRAWLSSNNNSQKLSSVLPPQTAELTAFSFYFKGSFSF